MSSWSARLGLWKYSHAACLLYGPDPWRSSRFHSTWSTLHAKPHLTQNLPHNSHCNVSINVELELQNSTSPFDHPTIGTKASSQSVKEIATHWHRRLDAQLSGQTFLRLAPGSVLLTRAAQLKASNLEWKSTRRRRLEILGFPRHIKCPWVKRTTTKPPPKLWVTEQRATWADGLVSWLCAGPHSCMSCVSSSSVLTRYQPTL